MTSLLALAVAGCGQVQGDAAPIFDGVRFSARAAPVDRADRSVFVSTVRRVSASPEGAVLAAEYAGIEHCITFFGSSDIVWEVPLDTDPAALPIVDDTLSLRGRCAG